jgi:hypothetical protein
MAETRAVWQRCSREIVAEDVQLGAQVAYPVEEGAHVHLVYRAAMGRGECSASQRT